MDDGVRWRDLAPPWLRRVPADLAAVVGLTVLAVGTVFLPLVRDTPLRIAVALPFVLFAPGYALVAVLFPEAEGALGGADGERDAGGPGISGAERVALAFGASVAIVPIVGLVLNFTPFGIRLVPLVVSLASLVLVLVAIATHRRWRLPSEERFAVPWRARIAAARTELLEPDSRSDAVLNVLLVLSVLVATASVGYAVAVPKDGESFTEFYLLTENDDGELVAAGYPSEFAAGESKTLVVGVENREGQPVDYTVLVEVHRVRVENNATQALEANRLHRFQTELDDNATWRRTHTVAPRMTGEGLRLTYLLYRGEAPSNPTAANAYRALHLRINVTRTN